MSQGFVVIGGLIVMLLRFFFPLGDQILIGLLLFSAMLMAGTRLGWLPAPADHEDVVPQVPPEPGLVERIRFDSTGLGLAGKAHGRWQGEMKPT